MVWAKVLGRSSLGAAGLGDLWLWLLERGCLIVQLVSCSD